MPKKSSKPIKRARLEPTKKSNEEISWQKVKIDDKEEDSDDDTITPEELTNGLLGQIHQAPKEERKQDSDRNLKTPRRKEAKAVAKSKRKQSVRQRKATEAREKNKPEYERYKKLLIEELKLGIDEFRTEASQELPWHEACENFFELIKILSQRRNISTCYVINPFLKLCSHIIISMNYELDIVQKKCIEYLRVLHQNLMKSQKSNNKENHPPSLNQISNAQLNYEDILARLSESNIIEICVDRNYYCITENKLVGCGFTQEEMKCFTKSRYYQNEITCTTDSHTELENVKLKQRVNFKNICEILARMISILNSGKKVPPGDKKKYIEENREKIDLENKIISLKNSGKSSGIFSTKSIIEWSDKSKFMNDVETFKKVAIDYDLAPLKTEDIFNFVQLKKLCEAERLKELEDLKNSGSMKKYLGPSKKHKNF
ncbi:unnamed protein product [Moneuplotes crassus]|uniref:Uncharacterized protein n=1 Tax=Euplotes crassus TaxID=5936 RepID=A0AAD1X687_EUPCR|nr:unnamed protein product [Moneuplotes crassus]